MKAPALPRFSPHFTVIGERINTHRSDFAMRVQERDTAAVLVELRRQQKAGVTHVDVNAGGSGAKESDDMLWLLDTILPALKADTGLVLDSTSHECLARALFRVHGREHTIINAVTQDTARMDAILPLVIQHNTGLIAILGGIDAAPRTADERLAAAEQLHRAIGTANIPDERLYFDPQVLPVASDTNQPKAVLETIPELRRRWPNAHILAGLSNVSFNLPRRSLLNRSYLAMLIAAGIDAVILNPRDRRLRETLIAARALTGADDFLTDYLAFTTPP